MKVIGYRKTIPLCHLEYLTPSWAHPLLSIFSNFLIYRLLQVDLPLFHHFRLCHRCLPLYSLAKIIPSSEA